MIGFIYGLAAMGLTLIFGVMRVINLAHGPIIAMGMFAVLLMSQNLGINPYLGLLVVLLVGLASGIVIYFVAVHRVINAPELTTLLATFSVNLMIIGIGTVIFSTSPRALDVDLGALRMGRDHYPGHQSSGRGDRYPLHRRRCTLFLYRTHLGKSIRAVANNRQAAELMGINSAWVLAAELRHRHDDGDGLGGATGHAVLVHHPLRHGLRGQGLRDRRPRGTGQSQPAPCWEESSSACSKAFRRCSCQSAGFR